MIRPDLHLSPSFLAWLAPYLAVFSRRTRPTASALAVGALLAVGPRTVTNCLRALGLAEHPGFTAFHRVLNRNAWSGLTVARQSKPRCQRQSATQSMVALRWAGAATVKPVAAVGGGLKGQALRASAQPRHWEADAT